MRIRKSARTSFEVKRDSIGTELSALVEKSEHRKYLALGLNAIARDVNGDSRTIEFTASTEAIDRYGDVIEQDGWNLDNFRKNPVFLWAHDSTQPPIGIVSKIGVANNELLATVQFATKDVYPFADTIFKLYVNGFMNAVSVGFMPLDYELSTPGEDSGSPLGVRFTQVELLEISAVAVPANPEALCTDDASHVPETFEKVLQQISGKPIKRDAIDRILDALNSGD